MHAGTFKNYSVSARRTDNNRYMNYIGAAFSSLVTKNQILHNLVKNSKDAAVIIDKNGSVFFLRCFIED